MARDRTSLESNFLCEHNVFNTYTYTVSIAPLRDLLDEPTALAACCVFDLWHKYILYLYLYLYSRASSIE
jgi:hypothetical protein